MHFCDTNSRGLLVVTFLGKIFSFVKIIIPIILILVGTLDLVKALASNQEKVKETQKKLTKKVIIGVAIFLIPTLVLFLLQLLGQEQTKCLYCFLSPYEDTCEYVKPKKKIQKPKKEEKKESKEEQKSEEIQKTPIDPETCKVHFSGACISNDINLSYFELANNLNTKDKLFTPSEYSEVLTSGHYLIKEANPSQNNNGFSIYDYSKDYNYITNAVFTTVNSIVINEHTKLSIKVGDKNYEFIGPKVLETPNLDCEEVYPDNDSQKINKLFSKSTFDKSAEAYEAIIYLYSLTYAPFKKEFLPREYVGHFGDSFETIDYVKNNEVSFDVSCVE